MLRLVAARIARAAPLAVAIPAVAAVAACRFAVSPLAGLSPPAADTSVFRAAILIARDSMNASTGVAFAVDPTPLHRYAMGQTFDTAAVAAEIQRRVATIDHLQIARRSATIPATCPSVLHPTFSANDGARAGCPSRQFRIVATSLPVAVSAESAGVVRVSLHSDETIIGPYGYSVEQYENIIERRDGTWRLVRRALLRVRE